MYTDDTRKKLEDIISGKHIDWQKDHCTTARNFLCTSFSPSTTVKKDFDYQSAVKEEQADQLGFFCSRNNLWLNAPPEKNRFLTEGGEAKVYFAAEDKHVVKLNDAAYYATWLDFLTAILIHNLIFEATSYELQGFLKSEGNLQAVLKQPFIISDEAVDLENVKKFLEFNGFKNTRRIDYYNEDLALILEDIHDENVIMNSGNMFFIDTVFYVDKKL